MEFFHGHGNVTWAAEMALLSCPDARVARSLLLQRAFNRARRGEDVLYVASSREALQAEEYARPGFEPEAEFDDGAADAEATSALDRIKLKYLPSDEPLRHLLASIHLVSPPPSLLVIEDLNAFHGADLENEPSAYERQSRLLRTLALATNAAEYLSAARAPALRDTLVSEHADPCTLAIGCIESSSPTEPSAEYSARRHFFPTGQLCVHGPLPGSTERQLRFRLQAAAHSAREHCDGRLGSPSLHAMEYLNVQQLDFVLEKRAGVVVSGSKIRIALCSKHAGAHRSPRESLQNGRVDQVVRCW